VLVVDLDLESPGLSSSLLPKGKRPKYGIADWLVEDLVDNGDTVSPYMMGSSELAHNGEINVIPAHGLDPGEYITKLGRVWMAKREYDNGQTICLSEPWYKRLNRLLVSLESRYKPDVVLIDSRAGIDEVSAACITALEGELILLFAIDSDQTWTGYDILFNHWLRCGAVHDIRERLQVVGALIPEDKRNEYFDGLCEHSYNLFTKSLYDEVPAGEPTIDCFNYDKPALDAPHYPWSVFWNRGFSVHQNFYTLQSEIEGQVNGVFGGLINGIKGVIENG